MMIRLTRKDNGAKRFPRKTVFVWCFLVVCILAVGIVVWEIVSTDRYLTKEYVVVDYTDDDSTLAKKRFTILLFPRTGDSEHEQPSGLTRAVLTNLEENAQDKVEVFLGNDPVKIDRSLLTAVPPPGAWKGYVDALNKELVVWGENTDWRYVKFEVVNENGTVLAELKIKAKKGSVYKYRYRIHDALTVVPVIHLRSRL